MAFIGNTPAESYVVTVKDSFNGTGSQTDFTLSQASTTNDVRVVVENVVQEPTTAYTVTGTTLTFTSAPPSGTGNIYVIHLGPAVATAVPPETFGVGSIYGASDPDTAITFEGSGVTTFDQNGTEAARFDASGNLLVGKTASATQSTVDGIELREAGFLFVTKSNDAPAYFHRRSSDGDIVQLRKDGTTVGSIGVDGGDNLYLTGQSGNTGGIYMNDSAVSPAYQGVERDNYYNLGKAPARWKDLYLSGGVYLGGTGAANYLDDYEEGTFTPNLIGSTSGEASYDYREGHYTKVGRLVTCHIVIGISSVNTLSGQVYINTLPFTVPNISVFTSVEASGSVGNWGGLSISVSGMQVVALESSTNAQLRYTTSGTTNTALTNSSIGNTFNFRVTLTYFTS